MCVQSKTVKVKQMLAVECGSSRMDFNVGVCACTKALYVSCVW